MIFSDALPIELDFDSCRAKLLANLMNAFRPVLKVKVKLQSLAPSTGIAVLAKR